MNKETFINPCDDYKRWSISEDCGCAGSMISYEQTPKTKCDCDAINQEFDNLWDAIDEIEEDISGITPSSGVCDCEAIRDEISAVSSSLSAHLSDDVSHITSEERTAWNAKLDASAYTPSSSSCECDLSEVNDRLTALESVSGQCHCSFDDYYTKEQVDALISGYTPSPQPSPSPEDRPYLVRTIDISGVTNNITCGSVSGTTLTKDMLSPYDYYTNKIESIKIGECCLEIGERFDSYVFQYLKNVDLNNGCLLRIGSQAFDNCEQIESITIPRSVIELGDYSLDNSHINRIIMESAIPPTFGTEVLSNHTKLYVPRGSGQTYMAIDNLQDYQNLGGEIIEY